MIEFGVEARPTRVRLANRENRVRMGVSEPGPKDGRVSDRREGWEAAATNSKKEDPSAASDNS